MRVRAQQALMNERAWNQVASFDQYAAAMRGRSHEQAKSVEKVRRERFERMMGDMVAKDIMLQWKAAGSLLKFDDQPGKRHSAIERGICCFSYRS